MQSQVLFCNLPLNHLGTYKRFGVHAESKGHVSVEASSCCLDCFRLNKSIGRVHQADSNRTVAS